MDDDRKEAIGCQSLARQSMMIETSRGGLH